MDILCWFGPRFVLVTTATLSTTFSSIHLHSLLEKWTRNFKSWCHSRMRLLLEISCRRPGPVVVILEQFIHRLVPKPTSRLDTKGVTILVSWFYLWQFSRFHSFLIFLQEKSTHGSELHIATLYVLLHQNHWKTYGKQLLLTNINEKPKENKHFQWKPMKTFRHIGKSSGFIPTWKLMTF